MEHHNKLITTLGLLVLLVGFVEPCFNHTFYVGGKDGWVLHPKETYSHWAQRIRFQVNDTLVFKYEKGSDSVLVVDKEAYNNCNKTNPKQTLDDGNSEFKFTRSGPFFFISGQADKCENGQKLIIVVMAVRNHTHMISNCDLSPPPSPPTEPPAVAVAPPTPPPTEAPAAGAPSTTTPQDADHKLAPTMNAAAPATSAASSHVLGGLIMGLGLVMGLVLNV